MEFRLLGAVEVAVDGRVLDAGPPQQRLVMAILAAEAGRLVSVEGLIARAWDEPPEHPRRALQVHLSRLRRLFDAEASGQPPVRVVRRSGGYLLDIDPDLVDVHRFRGLIARARDPECPPPERVTVLGRALELWRGQPLADLPGGWATRVRQGLRQQYLETVVAWAQESVRAGDPGEVLARLGELVGEHPLAESLATAYMRALYAAGRPADALDHYTTIRHRLVEELGTDPGPELQQLHRQILTADLALTAPGPAATRLVPRQLPAPPQGFTGRAAELAALDGIPDTSTMVIATIDGMAGVGKTALAVEAAHRLGGRYPDGQLFIDLHGHTHGVKPIEPAEALDHLLRALGIPGPQIPQRLDQRAALYRTRLADQQMLIVLDNAATEAQVTPLLPGSPGCLVLVTSRRRLAGLDHTHTVPLDTLPVADAVTLFRHTAGEGRLAGQPPELLAELVQLCGRLPLAIRIAATRLRSHPAWSAALLVERLRDQRHWLAELEAGQRSVTAALDLSYQHLSPELQRTYRLLGRQPGPDIGAYATAALLDSTLDDAGRMLEQLLDAHLLQEPTPGRYRFHDLTRAHAAHTATRDDTHPAQDAALERLLDYYRHTASLAMDAAYPYEREHRPQIPPARTPTPDMSDPTRAPAWLDIELPNLLAAAGYATEHGQLAHILHLSMILHRHLRTRGHYDDAVTLHRQALTTARATGQQAAELAPLTGLGHFHRLLGRYEQATDHYQLALQIARATGSLPGALDALAGLGWVHWMQGRYEQAADHFGQVLQIARATGHRPGELDALAGLGQVHLRQGRYEQATDHFGQALQIARATGNRVSELNALTGLGGVHRRQGRYEQATDHFGQALQIARTIGNRLGELHALTGLGQVHLRQGRYELATDHYQQLLDLAHESGDRNLEIDARQGLGRLQHATGHPEAAITHHDRALALARELGQPTDQARAHDGLAHAHYARHQPEQARRHWQHALNILTGLGLDHTGDEETTTKAIQAQLAALTERRAGTS